MTKPKSMQSFKRLKKTKKKEKQRREKSKNKYAAVRVENAKDKKLEKQTKLLELEIAKETRRATGINPTTYRKPKD